MTRSEAVSAYFCFYFEKYGNKILIVNEKVGFAIEMLGEEVSFWSFEPE